MQARIANTPAPSKLVWAGVWSSIRSGSTHRQDGSSLCCRALLLRLLQNLGERLCKNVGPAALQKPPPPRRLSAAAAAALVLRAPAAATSLRAALCAFVALVLRILLCSTPERAQQQLAEGGNCTRSHGET